MAEKFRVNLGRGFCGEAARSAAAAAGGGCQSLGSKAEPKADLHYKRWLSSSAKSCRLPSPGSPQQPGAGDRGQSRRSLPKADEINYAEHGPCGTPGARRSRTGFVPSSNAVSHPDVSGREAEEAGDGYY